MANMVAPALVSYHDADLSRLSTGANSLLRWLSRWFSQTEEPLFPSTAYIARKNKRHERTVYRWLSELRSLGCIVTETIPGIERRIVPQVAPADCPKPSRRALRTQKMSGVVSGVMSGVPPYLPDAYTEKRQQQEEENERATRPELTGNANTGELPGAGRNGPKAPLTQPFHSNSQSQQASRSPRSLTQSSLTARTEQGPNILLCAPLPAVTPCVASGEVPAGVAGELVAVGVSASTACALVAEYGEEVCKVQLASLPLRKAVDRSAVLVASIRQSWAIPEQVKESAQKAQNALVRAIESSEREKHRASLLERFSGLPARAQEAIEQRARSLWHLEQPQAARIMAGKAASASVVRGYVLRILEGG